MRHILPTLAIGLSMLLPVSASALEGFPAFPMSFWGTVTINGTAAPVGTIVRAYYGTTLAGTATVEETGIYGYTEPTKQKLVVGEGVGAISFTVQSASYSGGAETSGTSVITQSEFTSALTMQKNLAFAITVASSGGSSGGGGGGGGGIAASTPAPTSSSSGDATGDGKVDILDFNTLLIHWGKSGTGLAADLDNNGTIDIFDFNLLLINWSK